MGPRCWICDFNNTDGGNLIDHHSPRKFYWNKHKQGYECSACVSAGQEASGFDKGFITDADIDALAVSVREVH